MNASNPEFEPTIKSLMAELSEYIKEEAEDLLRLKNMISSTESEKLSKLFS